MPDSEDFGISKNSGVETPSEVRRFLSSSVRLYFVSLPNPVNLPPGFLVLLPVKARFPPPVPSLSATTPLWILSLIPFVTLEVFVALVVLRTCQGF